MGDLVRIVHDLAMDPHVALEWERFFTSGNVKTFDTLATMGRVKARECRRSEQLLRS
jgi:hypothetical protein